LKLTSEFGCLRQTFLDQRYDSTKELKNLLACVLVIDPNEAAALTADLTSLGFETHVREDDGVDLVGSDFVLYLVPADVATPAVHLGWQYQTGF